ncbi:MAG: 50S ribosomal protein L19 [Candidatus Peregrinibacteria bacterium GW2011_GWA2_47_7]|nr:MAG: 50S ribosomal protein L19 [Candidatus Peregrinibacteria bacterium GW2011_GWA2_47_7]
MSQQIIADLQKKSLKKIPELKSGYSVRVYQKVKEGEKERVQMFEGLVMKIGSGSGIAKTFTVRKVVAGIGVEKTFPFHLSTINKIEIVKKGKVRRARLYYMRKRFGKSATLHKKAGGEGDASSAEPQNTEQNEAVQTA